jgi:hypothetical protein
VNALVIQFQCSSEKCGIDYRSSVPDRDNISLPKGLDWPQGPPSPYPIEVYLMYAATAQCWAQTQIVYMIMLISDNLKLLQFFAINRLYIANGYKQFQALTTA